MLNRVTLIGRLTSDPDLRYSQSGAAVATFTLAVDRPFKNQRGEKETDFIPIITFRKLAEVCAENLGKGRLVAVDGRLQISRYEVDGQRRTKAEVVADTVQFLDRSGRGGGLGASAQADAANEAPEEDVPF